LGRRLRRMWESGATRRRIWRARFRRSRCYSCGLLGAYSRPDSSKALADLEEILSNVRGEWRWSLSNARRSGKLGSTEYDWRQGHDLGLATFRKGVVCGVGDSRGTSSTWTVPGPRQSDSDFLAMNHSGALVTEKVPDSRSIIGKPLGVVQTHLWELVQPHDCPYHMKHRPGWTPNQHHSSWVTRWPRRRKELLAVLVALGGLATLLAFLEHLLK